MDLFSYRRNDYEFSVLDLERSHADETRSRTLGSCALTCRPWLPRSRMHLYRKLEGSWFQHFRGVVFSSPSSSLFLPEHIQEVIGRGHFTFNTSLIALLPDRIRANVPKFTLQDSRFSPRYPVDKPKIFHPSCLMHLSQFRGLKSLRLVGYLFDSLNFIRRVLGAFDGLEDVFFYEVSWVPEKTPTRSLLRSTTWKLHTLTIRELSPQYFDTTKLALLYTWITPPPRAPLCSFKGAQTETSHPGLIVRDATLIVESLTSFQADTIWACLFNKFTVTWRFISQMGGCEFGIHIPGQIE